jgi:hypothetical protein
MEFPSNDVFTKMAHQEIALEIKKGAGPSGLDRAEAWYAVLFRNAGGTTSDVTYLGGDASTSTGRSPRRAFALVGIESLTV